MITAKTKLYAILGDPIEQALSPIVHNAAFQETGEDAVMVGLRVTPEKVSKAIDGMRAIGIAGVAVTMPLKADIIPFLDKCEEKIQYLGAVNVITCEDGVYTGHNTDGDGFVRNMREHGADPEGKRVLMFGAGGAAKGLCYALLEAGISELTVCNLEEDMAKDMFQMLRGRFSTRMEFLPFGSERIAAGCRKADVIVNATSMGMNGSPSPHVDWIPWEELPKTTVFADVIHKPVDTALIKRAREGGFLALTGDGMMLYQAVLAFQLFTRREAPVSVMKEAIQICLGDENR